MRTTMNRTHAKSCGRNQLRSFATRSPDQLGCSVTVPALCQNGGNPAVMSNVNLEPGIPADPSGSEEESSFADILSTFEQQHRDASGRETVTGTIVSVGPEALLVDIGRKIEGSFPIPS